MSLPCKDIKQCHSLSVGMIDETAWQRKKQWSHSLAVGMIDETAWQRNKAVVSLTACWYD
jgi:hypothetical protein